MTKGTFNKEKSLRLFALAHMANEYHQRANQFHSEFMELLAGGADDEVWWGHSADLMFSGENFTMNELKKALALDGYSLEPRVKRATPGATKSRRTQRQTKKSTTTRGSASGKRATAKARKAGNAA